MENIYKKYPFCLKIIILVTVIISLMFSIAYFIVIKQIKNYREDEIKNFINIIRKQISNMKTLNTLIEKRLDNNYFYISQEISKKLNKYSISELTTKQLEKIKKEYSLNDISILKKYKNEMKIIKTTNKLELGISTGGWGKWNEIFLELSEEKPVSIDKGYYKDNYWIGERTLSYYRKGYYKFAYYYNKKNDYLINLIIDDPYITNENEEITNKLNNIEQILYEFKSNLKFIDEIAIINTKYFLKSMDKNLLNNIYEPIFIYGSLNPKRLETLKKIIFNSIQNKEKQTFEYKFNDFILNITRIDENKVILMLLNNNINLNLLRKTILLFLFLTIILIILTFIMNYFLINKYDKLREIEKERLMIAENFKKTISELPDLIYKCYIDDNDEIYLTYVEGKFLKKVSNYKFDKLPKKIKEIFPEEFCKYAIPNLMKAFEKKQVKFDTYNNCITLENFVVPIYNSKDNEKNARAKEIMGMATNVTQRVIKEEKSRYMAYHDSLTNLPNRIFFNEYLETHLYRGIQNEFKMAIFFMDLDDFKPVNDIYGHEIGDILLKEFGIRVSKLLRTEDIFARIGGDEFALICRIKSYQNISHIAEKIINAVRIPFFIANYTLKIGVSIGISVYPKHGLNKKELIKKADSAMYEVKKAEKNSYKVYE